MTAELTAAYAHCRVIAKREAKNFYYGFMALPAHKRDAMCAVYAFMRRADDISDDESLSLDDRRELMSNWLASWRGERAVDPQDRQVFLAVRDVQVSFGVTNDLLEKLVAGTTMDLDPAAPAGVRRIRVDGRTIDQYESAVALERYCYLVASVVGLVTIRIFGFTDPAADAYAEQLGLAFQFTNILRDVKEDAERGRIYLPLEWMEPAGVTSADVLKAADSGEASPAMYSVLAGLGTRAETFYGAQHKLIPLLATDSRAAMRVLISIYHMLLQDIRAKHYRVFQERVSVSTTRKLAVLAKGMLGGLLARGGAKP
ncbi:phytoene/squalene synthase family protein [Terriglobus roseus]|uniref:Farnesyl-diphosphate farnesyltransferase n=1 Tax=Terriglobus roseus TaxID=392734 RepID=A0A1H4ISS8_9BACT|nr:phytoene/squalene synthase family protein [Terriglobus roseus]SEB36915.1 farnesyl-diphosphate farnesyltransferase [Terriglobus roseus]